MFVYKIPASPAKHLFYSPLYYQGGCIAKLENFIMDHLKLIGAVGVGVACVQVRHVFKKKQILVFKKALSLVCFSFVF